MAKYSQAIGTKTQAGGNGYKPTNITHLEKTEANDGSNPPRYWIHKASITVSDS
jgi:hypothetical protein